MCHRVVCVGIIMFQGATRGALFLARPPPAGVHSCAGQTATGDITDLAEKGTYIFRLDFWLWKMLHLLSWLFASSHVATTALWYIGDWFILQNYFRQKGFQSFEMYKLLCSDFDQTMSGSNSVRCHREGVTVLGRGMRHFYIANRTI